MKMTLRSAIPCRSQNVSFRSRPRNP